MKVALNVKNIGLFKTRVITNFFKIVLLLACCLFDEEDPPARW